MKKILYVGSIDDHIGLLKTEIEKHLPSCQLIIEANVNLFNAYNDISIHRPEIVLLSYSSLELLTRRFLIMIRKAFATVSFVVIYPSKESVTTVEKWSTLGDSISILKNPTVDEVIEYFAKKLGIATHLKINKTKAFFNDEFQLFQCMRVAHLGRTYAQLETNRYFQNDSKIAITFPYHLELFNSNQHKITKRATEPLYSHYKYCYQLEYLLQTNKSEGSVRTRAIKDRKYEISTLPINEKAYTAIIEATKEKKFLVLAQDKNTDTAPLSEETAEKNELDLLSRTVYFNWLIEQTGNDLITKDNVTIYDRKMHFLKNGLEEIDKAFVQIIHREEIGDYKKEIVSDMPSLIVVYLDEKNDVKRVKEMISAVTLLKDHFPYVLLFNYKGDLSSDDLRHKLEYHFVLNSKDAPDPYLVVRMLEIYRRKKKDKELKKAEKRLAALREEDPSFYKFNEKFLLDYKVYKEIDDPGSLIIGKVPGEILWMSETEIGFRTMEILNIGELFRIKNPFDLQIEITEVESNTKEGSPCKYTAHMHFVTETDKIAIKGFVEELAKINREKVSLNIEQFTSLKNKYFPFNFVYQL